MKRIDSETRKLQIIKAAMDIIAEGGSKSFVMVKIAERIGVTDAALYKHFKTKNDLLLFMLEGIDDVMVKKLIEHSEQYSEPKDKLKNILTYQFHFIQKNKSIPRILFSEALQYKDIRVKTKIKNIITKYKKYIEEIIQTGYDTGKIKSKINSEAAAIIFLGMIQFTVISWTLLDYSFSLKSREAVLWEEFSKIVK
ncbi:MAG: TetR/AcrR family transcriptional regulator [Melioribacteraceae bacterium]